MDDKDREIAGLQAALSHWKDHVRRALGENGVLMADLEWEQDRHTAEMQPNRALARMIAVHHTPPGCSPDQLAREIAMVLDLRCRAAFREPPGIKVTDGVEPVKIKGGRYG